MRFKIKAKSFTLIETIATIVIYAVMLLMITNIVLVNARLSEQLKIRSRIRTEMSQVMALIKRDIRNANSVESCDGDLCSMSVSNKTITWQTNSNDNLVKSLNGAESYVSNDIVKINSINFTLIPGTDSIDKRMTVIITLKAEGRNEEWKVTGQVIQDIISINSYELDTSN